MEDPNQPLGSQAAEDCHFLNIWAPACIEEPLPENVAIYGGGFEHGSASSWVMDDTAIAATGRAVVVAPNYRVGAFGFLVAALPAAPSAKGTFARLGVHSAGASRILPLDAATSMARS
ncbi:carboxylesterase family protein [Changpingibacter yushuensis]|uniref:carboxylesterase family protein n=1 Tax=Changpingibacter yushuensis TaxID=2758440 RepID=UPI0015F380F6|nr:carboxylesterase family protein [Changpingibacter yushuensis]